MEYFAEFEGVSIENLPAELNQLHKISGKHFMFLLRWFQQDQIARKRCLQLISFVNIF